MTTTVATLQAVITADSTGFIRSMDSVRGSISGVEQQSGSLAQTMGKVGATMTAAVTLPLLGIAAAGVKAASGFDASMHNINSIVHMTGEQMDALSAKTLAFGSTTREGPQAVADALYQVYSAGLTGAAAFDIMQVSTKTAEAGLADLDATTRAMTATMQAYSNQNITTAEASNVWTKMVQVGVGSMDEFVSGAQRVLPSGAALGITFKDLGANLAFMSQMGGGATQAETAVSMAMTNLMKPTKAMSAAFQKLGVQDASALIAKFGSLEGAVIALKGASENSVDFAKMFSKGGLQYVTAVTNNVDKAKQAVADFSNGLGDATQSAWDEQMKSFAAESDHFNSALSTLVITIGQQLLPILSPLIESGTKFILNLTRTNPEIIKMAIAFGIAVAAVGPLLLIITALFNPITLVIGVVAALGVAFSTNFLGIQTTVTNVLGTIGALIAPFITGMQALWQVVSGQGVDMTQASTLTTFVDDLQNIVNKVQGKATELNTTPVDIKIPIKAGMTLYDIYYNSSYSKDLQAAMSYDEFTKQAKTQIKGGDPRWLQVGDTLSFSLPVGPTIESKPITLKTGIDWGFQIVKDDIQAKYDFVFKGKPLVVGGEQVDAAKTFPVLAQLRIAVEATTGIIENWKSTASATLANISSGITGFINNFTKNVDWNTVQQLVTKAMMVINVLWLVFNTTLQGLIQVAGKVVGSALPVVGTILADFFNTLAHALNGKDSLGQDLLKIAIDIVAGINTFVNNITGTTGTFQEKFMALSGAIGTAWTLLMSAIQGGARDLKIVLNDAVLGILTKLASLADALLAAHIITPEQAATFKVSVGTVSLDTDAARFSKGIEDSLKAGGQVNMGDTLKIDGSNLKMQIQMGNAKAIADQLTIQGQEGLKAAIRLALTNNDAKGNLSVLLPIAVAGDLITKDMDFSKLSVDVQKKLKDAFAPSQQGSGASVGVGSDPLAALFNTSESGKAIVQGLSDGITANTPLATQAMGSMITDVQDTTNNALGIHSPSKWAAGVAGFIVAGMVAGFVVGTIVLMIASNLMAMMGIKIPLSLALSSAAGSNISSVFMGGLVSQLQAGNVSLAAAVAGIITAFATMSGVVLGIGNGLAAQMQVIVDKLNGQLASLKNAIRDAAGLSVPTGGGGGPATPSQGANKPALGAASGGSVGITWVGERGPEPVVFGQKGSVVSSRAVRDMVSGTSGGNSQSQTNNIVINGVQDVDKMLFELKRRGIRLQT